jgi:hypothetical protein
MFLNYPFSYFNLNISKSAVPLIQPEINRIEKSFSARNLSYYMLTYDNVCKISQLFFENHFFYLLFPLLCLCLFYIWAAVYSYSQKRPAWFIINGIQWKDIWKIVTFSDNFDSERCGKKIMRIMRCKLAVFGCRVKVKITASKRRNVTVCASTYCRQTIDFWIPMQTLLKSVFSFVLSTFKLCLLVVALSF